MNDFKKCNGAKKVFKKLKAMRFLSAFTNQHTNGLFPEVGQTLWVLLRFILLTFIYIFRKPTCDVYS